MKIDTTTMQTLRTELAKRKAALTTHRKKERALEKEVSKVEDQMRSELRTWIVKENASLRRTKGEEKNGDIYKRYKLPNWWSASPDAYYYVRGDSNSVPHVTKGGAVQASRQLFPPKANPEKAFGAEVLRWVRKFSKEKK